MKYPECRKYYKESKKILDWADHKSFDLENLIWDHKFLLSNKNHNKIILTVDIYDLIVFVLPFIEHITNKNVFTKGIQDEILNGQIARSSLFFSLPQKDNYYPIYIPPIYSNEFFRTMHSPTSLSSTPDLQIQREHFLKKMKRKFGEKKYEKIINNWKEKNISEDDKREVLNLLVEFFPDIMFYITGSLTKGEKLLRLVFQNSIVTFNVREWKAIEKYKKNILKNIEISDFNYFDEEENSSLKRQITDIIGEFRPSWMADIQAIRFVNYLNSHLNEHNIIVLFVSGAWMLNKLFRAKKTENNELISYRIYIKNPYSFASKLNEKDNPLSKYLFDRLSRDTIESIQAFNKEGIKHNSLIDNLESDLNNIILNEDLIEKVKEELKDSNYVSLLNGIDISENDPATNRILIRKVFENEISRNPEEYNNVYYHDKESQLIEGGSFRGIDTFRFYASFREQLNSTIGKEVDPGKIVDMGTNELKVLKGSINKKDRDTILQRCKYNSCEDNENIRKKCKRDGGIDQLFTQVHNIKQIKGRLSSIQLINSLKVFLKKYEGLEIDIFSRDTYKNISENNAEIIINAIKKNEELNKYYIDAIIQLKISLANELLGLLGWSNLHIFRPKKQVFSQQFSDLFHDFTLFPFRVKFVTPALITHIKRIRKIFIKPVATPSPGRLKEFYDLLLELAQRCSPTTENENNFWEEDVDISHLENVSSVERRLIWLILLFCIGYHKQVIHDADYILQEMKDMPLQSEIMVMELQSRIGEMFRIVKDDYQEYYIPLIKVDRLSEIQKKSIAKEHFKQNRIARIFVRYKEWQKKKYHFDSRIWYLFAFATGLLARSSQYREKNWFKNFDKNWAIKACDKALKLLDEEISNKVDNVYKEEDEHFRISIAYNKAYYLSIDGDSKQTEQARAIYDKYKIDEKQLTTMCLRNKGYVFYSSMLVADNLYDIGYFYKIAQENFLKSEEVNPDNFNLTEIFEKDTKTNKSRINTESLEFRLTQETVGLKIDATQLELDYRRLTDKYST